MNTPTSIPPPFPDEFPNVETAIGKPVVDHREHAPSASVLNMAIEGYACTGSEIEAVRPGLRSS